MSNRHIGKLLVSTLGRSLLVALITLLVAACGLAVGYFRGMEEANPDAQMTTLGGETAGIASMIVVAFNLALGTAGGAIAGLVIGVVMAILWPRRAA
ncbi:hypothetical protein [Tautonia plasticadhaerens]|uniref:Uncharacterized protein n=1 Tax=Tautonia plasticadhaerens TaxID=2527974 RepID=A0A518H679_9BACT|nr:hypothetical protein [Tautonia plasticadhaerens]QDV36347.1 hypothetical protein ElP_42670 [Tautonia plasticadhaerens]